MWERDDVDATGEVADPVSDEEVECREWTGGREGSRGGQE